MRGSGCVSTRRSRVPWYVSVVQGDWKLIHYLQPEVGDELYDLKRDPEELNNQISLIQSEPQLKRLREALVSELQRTEFGEAVKAAGK